MLPKRLAAIALLNHSKQLLAFGLVLLLCVACGGDEEEATPIPPPPTQAASAPSNTAANTSADDPGINLLVTAQGDVKLKRNTWADYYVADFGVELHRGDLIRLGNGSEALVLCDGLTTWQVPAGAPAGLNNGCPPPPESVLVRGTSLVGNTRGSVDPLIPYVISPRKTKLLTTTPVLRWNPVLGVANYTVLIRGDDVEWQSTTSDTSLVYPGNPPLTPGTAYALIIETDSGASSRDEDAPGLGFTILSEAEAAAAQATQTRITALNLAPEAAAIALTQFYRGNGLLAEAIETLESVVEEDLPSANVYRLLGDLYRQTGLVEIAGTRYATAISKAEAANNLETLAAAQEGLAEVNVALGDQAAAVDLLTSAQTGYQTLGDTEKVNAVHARIAALGD